VSKDWRVYRLSAVATGPDAQGVKSDDENAPPQAQVRNAFG
jgi:hypothetical protein